MRQRRRYPFLLLGLVAWAVAQPRGARADGRTDERTVDVVRKTFPKTKGWFKLVADARFVTGADGSLSPNFAALTHPRVRAKDGAGFSLEPRFPAQATGAVHIGSSADPRGIYLELSARDAARVDVRVEDGLVIYPEAYVDTDLIFKATPTHVDEYLVLKSRAAPTTWRYAVERGPGIARLRQAGSFVEAVDAKGHPWLRAGRPVAFDTRGGRVEGTITVIGDELVVAIDTRTLTPPILVDPDWRSTGDMAHGRFYNRVNVMPNGRIVATGGCSASVCSGDLRLPLCPTVVGAAESLDLGSRTWSQVGEAQPRFFHAAEVLDDGRLFIAGGCTNSNCTAATSSVQTWASGTFSDRPSLAEPRGGLLSAHLGDGHVLVAGGCTAAGCTASSELYDATSDTLAPAGAMTTARGRAASIILADGRVLAIGGCTSIACAGVLASAEIYDPVAGTWTATGTMATARAGHFAALLSDGRVLVGGGCSDALCTTVLSSTEVYDPASGTFVAGPDLARQRVGAEAMTLPDGRVVVVQGCASKVSCDLSNEVYVPTSNSFATFPPSRTVRAFHQVVRHDASRQLVAIGGCQPQTCSWWNETLDISDAYGEGGILDAGVDPPGGGGSGGGGGGGCCGAAGDPAGAGALALLIVLVVVRRRGPARRG